jgi:hypothetical protein
MIDNYKILCNEAEKTGKYEAYKAYTQKYPYFFHGVFQYLYCQPIDNLKSMIERVDFRALLQVAESNYTSGMVDYAIDSIKEFVNKMQVDFDFSFLLGLELSNIGGCATPSHMGEPHLYIGIDRPLTKEWLSFFVPHELFHMLRAHTTQDNAPETVFSRTIEEGLASYAPLWVHNMEWSVANVAKTLNVSEIQADSLMQNTDSLLAGIVRDGNEPISLETMNKYFVAQSFNVEFPVIGYYIGLYLTHLSVKNGVNFEQFVSMERHEIINMWFK